MGWSEAQYVVDELMSPLLKKGQISDWIADYKMWGTDSFVYNIPYMLDAIYLSEEGVNDMTINVESLSYAINKGGTAFNTWLCSLAPTKDQASTLFAGIMTPEDLAANAEAIAAVMSYPVTAHTIGVNSAMMSAICASETACAAIYANEDCMDVLNNDVTAIKVMFANTNACSVLSSNETYLENALGRSNIYAELLNSSILMHYITATGTAYMTRLMSDTDTISDIIGSANALNGIAKSYTNTAAMLIFLKKINSSSSYVTTMYKTLSAASDLFTSKQVGYYDGVTQGNSYTTAAKAPNAFIACACGYYSTTTHSVNVLYNGTTLASSKTGTKMPQSVTSSNVNVISMAPSTFTENNDGYLAIQTFTAN